MWLTLLGVIGCVGFFWAARDLRKHHIPFWQERRKLCDPYFASEASDGPGRFGKCCPGAEVAQLVEKNSELHDLYARIGYSHGVHKSVLQILDSLCRMPLRVKIPDLEKFHTALSDLRDRCKDRHKDSCYAGLTDYVGRLLEAGNDLERVTPILLTEGGAYRNWLLGPFISCSIRIEFEDGAEVQRLVRDLGEIYTRWSPQLDSGHRDRSLTRIRDFKKALDKTGWVDVQQERDSLNSDLQLEWEGNERRGELDSLLLDLIRAEREPVPDIADISSATKAYLDRPWMQLPYLTYYLRTLLVGALVDPFERAVFGAEVRLFGCIGIGFLLMALQVWGLFVALGVAVIDRITERENRRNFRRLWDLYEEVRWKGYEPEEIVRRLRTIEESGVNVPSIAYPLFRVEYQSREVAVTAALTAQ